MCGLEMYPIGPVIPHNITIDMTPINPPIQIPAIGGSFQYTVTLLNADTLTVNFNAWIKAQLPNGSYYLCAGPVTLNFVVGQTLSRTRTQNVPGGAPSGDYLYIGYVGLYPNNIWNQDSFPFTKLAGDGSGGNWYNWGESFDGSGEITGLNPTKCEIIGSYPNPFNPRTNIRYNLPEAGNVKLVVYDVTGREVVTLMNGWLDAGIHESVFYADNLPSGIYFYSLTAGDYTVTEKMVLTK
jgi:hypothetical protein